MTPAPVPVSTHTHFFRGEDEVRAAVTILGERAAAGRSPRAWCAGCSTGPEPYTLAILCAERALDVAIHATDIHQAALDTARSGRFRDIDLRTTPEDLILRHFARDAEGLLVAPALRRAVTFEHADLRFDPPPAALAGAEPGFDVILCRNVILYYDPEIAAAIVSRLARALRPDGVLIVAPTDPLAFRLPDLLRSSGIPGIAAYTRATVVARGGMEDLARVEAERFVSSRAAPAAEESPAPSSVAPPLSRRSPPVAEPSRAPPFVAPPLSLRSPPAAEQSPAPSSVAPPLADAVLAAASLAAHAWADAEAALLRAERADPLAIEPPLLFGLLRRKQGRLFDAASHLRRAAFLAPESWLVAYLLAGVWERLGEPDRAHLERRRTLQILERAPAGSPPAVAALAGITYDPGEIARICRERSGD